MPLTLDSPRHREGRTPGHAGLAAVRAAVPTGREPVAAQMLRLTGVDITRCPGVLVLGTLLTKWTYSKGSQPPDGGRCQFSQFPTTSVGLAIARPWLALKAACAAIVTGDVATFVTLRGVGSALRETLGPVVARCIELGRSARKPRGTDGSQTVHWDLSSSLPRGTERPIGGDPHPRGKWL